VRPLPSYSITSPSPTLAATRRFFPDPDSIPAVIPANRRPGVREWLADGAVEQLGGRQRDDWCFAGGYRARRSWRDPSAVMERGVGRPLASTHSRASLSYLPLTKTQEEDQHEPTPL
jgi:hypothetical protein